MREKATSTDQRAGCFVCNGVDAIWTGKNAQAVAARHHDATKHATWCDVYLSVRYGQDAPAPGQLDIETAIAAVPA